MTKVVKIYLISKVTDKDGSPVDYKDVNKILWDLQKQTREIKNKAIQLCWEWHGFSSDYNFMMCEYPEDKEILGCCLTTDIYRKIKDSYKINSGNLQDTIREACSRFKNDKKDYLKGIKSIASFKSDQPLTLRAKNIRLNSDNKEFFFELSLLNNKYSSETRIKSFKFKGNVEDKSTRMILERCIDNIYKISESKLIYDKNKKMWKLNLCYSFENNTNHNLDRDKILGVDLGISKPVVASVYGDQNSFIIDSNEIEAFRKQIESRRIALLRQTKYCGEGRIGHGRKTRTKPALKIGSKVLNFRETTNFKYAKALVDYAVKNNCGTIQMEDLSGISDTSSKKEGDKKFLKNWSYYDLQMKIINKAAEHGIKVNKVDPKYTSQRCSVCGFISESNRPTQEKFRCPHCYAKQLEKAKKTGKKVHNDGYINADYNASQNLAIKDIDKIINAWCESTKKQVG